jgi:outer membrane protein
MHLVRRAALIALTLAAVPGTALVAQGGQPAARPNAGKIVYVNSRQIIEQAPGRAAAEQAFNKEMEGIQAQVRRMGDSLQTMIADYQKVQATLSAAQREQREKTIRERQDQYQQRAQQLEQQAQQRQMAYIQPLMDQIRNILDDIRQEEGYAFILDAGSEANVIVAADRNLDITPRVISRLKPLTANAPAAGGARPDSARATPTGARPSPAGVTRRPPTQ